MFLIVLIAIPFKGCQGRSNRSSIVHAVSMIPHTVHPVSMTPHAPSGAQDGCFDEKKTEGRKSRDTVPLTNFVYANLQQIYCIFRYFHE
jgi:hypothetical protein